MCGRFVRKSTITEITEEFGINEVQWAWEPSYNVAPGQNVACVIQKDGNRLVSLRWGLIPSWADDPQVGYRMINARAETLSQKRTFSRILKTQRCLVVADGFYEWRKENDKKVPMYIRLRSSRPFGFAGLYDTWRPREGSPISSCTIITTRPNEVVGPIHNRMPVIVPRKEYSLWLDNSVQDPGTLLPLLEPFNAKEMEAYEVSLLVNSPKFNTPECIKPVRSK
jgi:putative SOS response-associated peptidase YedK